MWSDAIELIMSFLETRYPTSPEKQLELPSRSKGMMLPHHRAFAPSVGNSNPSEATVVPAWVPS